MTDQIEFILDGKTVTAEAGETIWQVAEREGVEIPHLCYSTQATYRPDGNCRVCMVEIEGERTLAASCLPVLVSRMAHGFRSRPGRVSMLPGNLVAYLRSRM